MAFTKKQPFKKGKFKKTDYPKQSPSKPKYAIPAKTIAKPYNAPAWTQKFQPWVIPQVAPKSLIKPLKPTIKKLNFNKK